MSFCFEMIVFFNELKTFDFNLKLLIQLNKKLEYTFIVLLKSLLVKNDYFNLQIYLYGNK